MACNGAFLTHSVSWHAVKQLTSNQDFKCLILILCDGFTLRVDADALLPEDRFLLLRGFFRICTLSLLSRDTTGGSESDPETSE